MGHPRCVTGTNPQCVLSSAMLTTGPCLLLVSKPVPHVNVSGIRSYVLRPSGNTHSQNPKMSGPGGTLETIKAHLSCIYRQGIPQRGKGLAQGHTVIWRTLRAFP